jgi:hypothetical protein
LLAKPSLRTPHASTISRETLVGGEFGAAMTPRGLRPRDRTAIGRRRARLARGASNAVDLDRFAAFARELVDLAAVSDDLPPRSAS